MLFDLNSAYKQFDRDVQFSELTEDDKILNDAYEFVQKNSPTSGTVGGIIRKTVEKLERGKGTFGESLFRINSPSTVGSILAQYLWDDNKVDVMMATRGYGRWSMSKDEVVKKIKHVKSWWKQVLQKCNTEIDKRKKELLQK